MLGFIVSIVFQVLLEFLVFGEFYTKKTVTVICRMSTHISPLHQGVYFHHYSQWLLQRVHLKCLGVEWGRMELGAWNKSIRHYLQQPMLAWRSQKKSVYIARACWPIVATRKENVFSAASEDFIRTWSFWKLYIAELFFWTLLENWACFGKEYNDMHVNPAWRRVECVHGCRTKIYICTFCYLYNLASKFSVQLYLCLSTITFFFSSN